MRFMKKVISLLMVILLLGTCVCQDFFAMQVYATETDDEEEEDSIDKEYQKTMERVYNTPADSDSISGWPEGPKTHGEAAIVMEVGTGTILYAKNIDSHYYPASITKLLTALVALQNSKLTDTVKITDECVDFLNWDDAWIGLKAGNTITMEDAMHAMLMASANEAAYAIAMNVGELNGQDYDWFIEQMNETMKSLGGKNSNFVNANGLQDEKHYTTARDMALVGKELFKYSDFFRISQTLEYKIKETKNVEEHVFQQYHKMLLPYEDDYYPYAIGGKLGYTDEALSTLVTMTEKDGMQLVTVVLKTYGVNIYPDTTNLCEYAYNNFQKLNVSELEMPKDISGYIENEEHPGYVVIPYDADTEDIEVSLKPDDPNIETSTEAVATYTYKGQEVGSAKVQLSDRYVAIHKKTTEENEQTTVVETKPDDDSYMNQLAKVFVPLAKIVMANRVLQILLIVFVALFFLLILILRFRAWRRKKLREKRKRERKLREKQLRQQELEEQEEEIRRKRKAFIAKMRQAGYSDDEIRRELARAKKEARK